MPRPGYRTAAQQKGARMRARGRNYRGGYTRDEISRDEHRKRTCHARGCLRRQEARYCAEHDDSDDEEDV